MNKKPNLYGLQQAVEIAQVLLSAVDKKDLEAYVSTKESLRKARENLRVFSYKQKGHVTARGTVLRA